MAALHVPGVITYNILVVSQHVPHNWKQKSSLGALVEYADIILLTLYISCSEV